MDERPQRLQFFGGQYHLFYQYHPYATQWGPMHWGHVVSRDLLRWEYLPAAIGPDMPYDKDGCFSGSATELADGRHLLMYTGARSQTGEDGGKQEVQTQCIAVGDGVRYEKYEGNPVLDGKDLPAAFSRRDFRDPKIFPKADGGFGCVVGNRTEDGSGAVLLFESEDGFQWQFTSVLDRSRNELGRMWECPDMFRLDTYDVILTSPQEMCPQGLEFHNGNNTMAMIGTLRTSPLIWCGNPLNRRETYQFGDEIVQKSRGFPRHTARRPRAERNRRRRLLARRCGALARNDVVFRHAERRCRRASPLFPSALLDC